ncbi:hypothetical protein COEREDRAFT_83025 [Coemansia reversa NRRL 1564]|uniref:Dipeptidyl-peptidase V n=1 Tax=Coemansia reversa (strain ATCC 12441 / NRRL 1564) TaxID=763665 RepID=A0A2G5B4V7_COERN|nr:hypothetical protein COEREDRAFT_83025 [Coemansia reversa NRRL 1564]|eukprot:PIA14083.1 hypothetical protein COEREDRAFT_83025 [Coemansia reversa NRRL 1564]
MSAFTRCMLCGLLIGCLVIETFGRTFTPEDLVQTNRLSGSVALSPDGTDIAYITTQYSIEAKEQSTQLVIQSLGNRHRSPVIITDHTADARPNPPHKSLTKLADIDKRKHLKASQPVWLGKNILGFVTTDQTLHKSTLYSVHGSGSHWSKPHRMLTFPIPISDVHYSQTSGVLAFTAEVYNGTNTLKHNAELEIKNQERADSAQTYDELWVRHWDTFVTPKLPQIHTMRLDVGRDGSLVHRNKARNIVKDTVADGRLEVTDSFTFSPNGLQVAFVAKKPGIDYAWRTTSYVYLADVNSTAAVPINENGEGASTSPVFSHDGSKLAYMQMESPTYEADRNQIKIYDFSSKSTVSVALNWDRSPANIIWVDEMTLLATYNDWGRNKLAKIDIGTGTVTPVIEKHSVGAMQHVPNTDKLLISYDAFDMPTDLYTVSINSGDIEKISDLNPQLGNEIHLSSPEDLVFVGADNATIHGFMLHPPDFDAQKKYPLAYVIHGGPQLSFTDSWSTRWNLNIFAAAGFVTVAMDMQGSTGYGQDFTDAIRNQWGGKPYESLMLSLQQLLDAHLYIDRDRLVALGASYGGYMINWLNGHTDIFKALVNHDGVFSLVSTYYSTEELYFAETENEGVPFDKEARENYERWSPERFVSEWKTPTLVIHGEKDYRLTVSEGLSTFTALRRQGIPARLLYFPDENHWVLKPANSLRWHQEVLDWITRWTLVDGKSAIYSIGDKSPKFVVQGKM